MPTVSIAVPTYNSERYIAQSLESLLGQTFADFELVISDNASTDGTQRICEEFAARDQRVRYVRRSENIGGPGNFCHVFSLCSGKYHKWSTSDDYWDKTFLAKAVAILDARPDVVLCYPKTRLIDAAGETIADYDDDLDLQQQSPSARFIQLLKAIELCNAHLGLIRRSAMLATRLIGPELGSDVHFLAELALSGKFELLPERLFFRRFHEHSSSWNRADAEHQRKYYDPRGSSRGGLQTWKKYRRLVSAAWRARVGIGEKRSLGVHLSKLIAWNRHELLRELAAVARRG
jgi:glycosyltransferase involved in cell wall biosynthesis